MGEQAHTAGPWDYVPGTEHHGPYVTTDYGSTVADCYTMSRPPVWSSDPAKPVPFMMEMAEANARLIAAAPCLLEALEDWLEAAEHDYGVPDEEDGDGESVALGQHGGSATTFGHLRRARAAIQRATGGDAAECKDRVPQTMDSATPSLHSAAEAPRDYIPADDHVTTGDASELAAQARFNGSAKPSFDNRQCSNAGAGEQEARDVPTGGAS